MFQINSSKVYLEIPLLKSMPWIIRNILILYILRTRKSQLVQMNIQKLKNNLDGI
jgi:hypothetical protein